MSVEMNDFFPEPTVEDQLREALAKLKQLMAAPKAVAKNHRPGKADPNVSYVLLRRDLPMFGNVPRQQLDLSKMLLSIMVLGVPMSEPELFNQLVDAAGEYASIYKSKQDVTYLFRYYRSVKKEKTLGFLGRGFLRMIG